MTDYYCDQSHTNNGDGDGWADQVGAGGAFNSIQNAISGGLAAGDRLFVRNDASNTGSQNLLFPDNAPQDPVFVFGVKAATTATPPAQSDLVPGIRTGDTTRAYAQTGANAAPVFNSTSGAMTIRGCVYIYGLVFHVGATFGVLQVNESANVDSFEIFEECEFHQNYSAAAFFRLNSGSNVLSADIFFNCRIRTSNHADWRMEGISKGGYHQFIGTVFERGDAGTTQPNNFMDTFMDGVWEFIGCDFSDLTSTLVEPTSGSHLSRSVRINFINCHINSSSSLGGSSPALLGEVALYGSEADGAAKTSGESRQNLQIETRNGEIADETTAVRTGGATDRATGGFSWAMTPNVDDTVDNYVALYSPWIRSWIRGDGTSKTITVYIANSGAGDYQDDEVWLEAYYPAEDGGAQHAFKTNQMGLLGTATNITDDTDSTWGSGGNNPQKLELSIAPDYSGPIDIRVAFSKNFTSSPETLYVDPKIYGIPGSHQFMTPGGLISAPVAAAALIR